MDFVNYYLCIPAIVLLLFTGIRLSLASNWLQIRGLPAGIRYLFSSKEKGFSSLAAFCTVVGGNLGVGNISGTAVALKSGSPGFIVWMVIVIVVTSVIKYTTCYLSIYTKTSVNGKVFGGPPVYLQHVFGKSGRWASLAAALITATCALTVGNLVQANSLSIPMLLLEKPPIIAGIVMAVVLFMVSVLGMNFIAKMISSIVPVMALVYLGLSVATLSKFSDNILPSLKLIFDSFMCLDSFRHGSMAAFLIEIFSVVQVGVLRGIFATDIGLGLEGTVHSLVAGRQTGKNLAIQQGLISLISPFIVAIVTIITTIVLLVTGVWNNPGLESTNMCFVAFKGIIGDGYTEYTLLCLMFCLSFTTILAWFVCSREGLAYVFQSSKCDKTWVALFILVVPIGSVCTVQTLWDIADTSIAVSVIINTAGILLLVPKYKNIFSI